MLVRYRLKNGGADALSRSSERLSDPAVAEAADAKLVRSLTHNSELAGPVQTSGQMGPSEWTTTTDTGFMQGDYTSCG